MAKEQAGNMAENNFSINDAPTMKPAPPNLPEAKAILERKSFQYVAALA